MFYRNRAGLLQLIFVLCILVAIPSAHAGTGKPVAVVETTTYNFGEVYERTDITYDFVIKNTGDADLEINKVSAK